MMRGWQRVLQTTCSNPLFVPECHAVTKQSQLFFFYEGENGDGKTSQRSTFGILAKAKNAVLLPNTIRTLQTMEIKF